jgi:hypothetical protein
MAGYYFVKSDGHLFRLTKKAYQTWVVDSANRLTIKGSPAKLKKYGVDLGEISNVLSAKDIGFETLSKLFSSLDTESNI